MQLTDYIAIGAGVGVGAAYFLAIINTADAGALLRRKLKPTRAVGAYYMIKARDRLTDANHATVAKQLRKQGVPLEIARLIIFGKP